MLITKNDKRIEKLKEIEASLRKRGDLYIWGCSRTSLMLTDFCNRYSEVEIKAYIVDDSFYQFDSFENKQVYKASDWKKITSVGDFVLFGFTNAERAKDLIYQMPTGVEGIYFTFPYSANVNGQYITYDYYQKNKKQFDMTYDLLADNLSKNVMEAFLNGCISGEVDAIDKLKSEGQYFNELTKGYKKGCFVDLGAYVGDTIEEAYNFYGDDLEQVVAFEPDPQNIELLKKRMMECKLSEKRWKLVDKGSWSEQTSLYFSSSNSSSSFNDDGDIKIDVDSLDNVMQENSIPVSYIKMDVEGSEKASLQGAKDIIKQYHPLIAVCVYHKMSDLFELIQQIQDIALDNEYSYYLRYYGPDLRELVLYAIPM